MHCIKVDRQETDIEKERETERGGELWLIVYIDIRRTMLIDSLMEWEIWVVDGVAIVPKRQVYTIC